MKKPFPSQIYQWNALSGEVTDDVMLCFGTVKRKKRVLISSRPLIDQDNHVVAAVVTIRDISKYKQLEDELKENRNKYRKLIGFRKQRARKKK
jgi:sensor histidine kinase regulating citrate/malate metabolism